MQHHPHRRAGIARVPLRLVILVIIAVAALAAAGCADDDGFGPYNLEEGIAGRWVRYDAGTPGALDVVVPYSDTLWFDEDGRGRYSYEVRQENGPSLRGVTAVVLVIRRPFLLLDISLCTACEGTIAANRLAIAGPPPAPRFETRVPGPLWRIHRNGPDQLELGFVHAPEAPRHHYRRDPSAPVLE